MSNVAHLPIEADRYGACVRQILIRGLDLTGVTMRAQVRLSGDAPGAPLVDLQTVTNGNAEGLRLVGVDIVEGLPVSHVELVINETTMEGLPYAGELGSPTLLAWDWQAMLSGRKQRIAKGMFNITGDGVTGADNSPLNRPAAWVRSSFPVPGMRTGATLTFGDEVLQVTIDGANLLAPLAAEAQSALDRINDFTTGPTGPANNTYTSYAALIASDPTRKYAYLVGDTDSPPRPDGTYANPSARPGAWEERSAAANTSPASVVGGGALDILSSQTIDGQAIAPSRINVHAFDDAIMGTVGVNPNPTFTGTPPTGYTLTGFAKDAGGLAHSADSAGSFSINVPVGANRLYQLAITFTTTAYGGIAFSVGGIPILNTGDFSSYEPGTYTIVLNYASRTTAGTVPLTLSTDATWAGSVASIDLIPPQREMPNDFVSVPSDNRSFSNPYALKHGRNEQGNQIWGDRLAGAFLGPQSAWNVVIGPRGLAACVSGQENVAVGAFALQHFAGGHTTAVGYGALGYLTIGLRNTALGYKAGQFVSIGNDNSSVGHMANFLLSTGSANTAFGQQANYYNRRGGRNVAIGNQALLNNDGGSGNTAVGDQAGPLTAGNNTFAWDYSTCLGAESKAYGPLLLSAGALGRVGSDPNTSGGAAVTDSTGLGPSHIVDASESVGVGNNVVVAKGATRSVAVGTGSKNNSANGVSLGYIAETGPNSTALGPQAKALQTNAVAVGLGATTSKNNQMVFGNADNDEFVFGGVVVPKAKLIALLATVP